MTADATHVTPAGKPALDEAAFLRLLEMAGPTDASELMRRLQGDLRDVASGLAAGFAVGDRAALRKHSHVLLAVAGTIGAHRLRQQAQDLNLCAKDEACVLTASASNDLLNGLRVLLARLREMATELGLEG